MTVNVFAYSEPYELDLLEIKFNLEDAGVDKWIIVENDYSLRGNYKGRHNLNEYLREERFAKFKDKIVVIETSYRVNMHDKEENYDIICYQRNLEKQWLVENCNSDDWVIISDLDESVNFDENKDYILSKLIPGRVHRLIQKMYFLDFDNLAGEWNHSIMLQYKDIIEKYNRVNLQYYLTIGGTIPIENAGYHYLNCFSKEDIWRKLNTYGHNGFTFENIESWCKYNHGGGDNIQHLYKGMYHLETVVLDENNSPRFVRENLDRFKTNIISKTYQENRRLYALQ